MTDRDYKNAGRTPRYADRDKRAAGGVSLWAWVFIGMAVGGSLALGGPVVQRLRDTLATLGTALEPPSPRKPPPQPPDTLEPPDSNSPEFEFYRILPEMEVIIPPEELETIGERETGHVYRLQVGSFEQPGDAEKLRARCALLGFAARIAVASVEGRTWYRVRIGPFQRARDADTARRRLFDDGIESIVLRETPEAPDTD